jgi:hypothetical protein
VTRSGGDILPSSKDDQQGRGEMIDDSEYDDDGFDEAFADLINGLKQAETCMTSLKDELNDQSIIPRIQAPAAILQYWMMDINFPMRRFENSVNESNRRHSPLSIVSGNRGDCCRFVPFAKCLTRGD